MPRPTDRTGTLSQLYRNDPGLGIKINGTLALTLPYICRAHANISHCPGLLHLAPGSPDAQIFEDFARSLAANSSYADAGSGGLYHLCINFSHFFISSYASCV
ncbi:hypothetical protein RHGRI_006222 [Rhododendron griersonianum]|uniref:Uncharacterized protein n=1 Tax=Rhododendron griersonianum TaxID=479676 RepID=A0AAV6KSB1_9ERIC|nr:hypothetical protein RHGRI_006222 [Rhododendron griersonianum]